MPKTSDQPRNDEPGRPDAPTLVAIALLAYILAVVLHELGGHGGACVALGGAARELGAYYLDCDYRGMGDAQIRLVAAAGNTVNLGAALAARPFVTRAAAWHAKWFWWLFMAVNLLDWAGYFFFSGVSGIGDWGWQPHGVMHGTEPQWAWRAALALAGGGLYYASVVYAARLLGHLVDAPRTARRLALLSYLTGGLLALLVGLRNPLGMAIVITSSLASTLGGTSGLLWLPHKVPAGPEPGRPAVPARRSWGWIACGAIAALLFALVLGPSRTLA